MAEALKVYWYGYGGNMSMAEDLRPVITGLGMELFTISEWAEANIKWDRSTWLNHLKAADIIIVPANWKVQPCKSNNRLTQAMSLGKPVIASPLPAYLRVAEKHPESFLIADTPEEWREALTRLRDSPELRQSLSQKAASAAQHYSLDAMAGKWLSALNDLDVVDIVIPTYSNFEGLKLCMESIQKCTTMLYNIIVVNNGQNEELHKWLDSRGNIIYNKDRKMTFSQAVNRGIGLGSGKYVCILNDDVIVSKGWLEELVRACGEGVGAVGPLSNCDKGWLHNLNINIGGVDLLPGLNTIEQIAPIADQIHDYQSPYQDKPERDWTAFYCTLIPRAVINKVGVLNEEYTNSGEDVDLCRRIKKHGYKIVQNYKSFVFHFGAVSRKFLEKEDPGSYHSADLKTNQHLRFLWERPTVMIYSGPAWERWDWNNLERGIGGSEVWVIHLSRELSKLGYRVTVFADCPESNTMDGDVLWLHYAQYDKWVNEHWTDYAILSRTTDPLRHPLRASKVFVQIHDIWLLSAKEQIFSDRVNKFCALSDWHIDFASSYHSIPKEKMQLTANGIDFSRFDGIEVERNPHRLMWTSSLDRGLDNVLYLWPFIRSQVPDAELHVFYGMFNYKESAKSRGDQNALNKIKEIEEALKQPGVIYRDRVSQDRLAIEFKRSAVWLYPSAFEETFCISSIEAQRAGVPVVANKYAGLITTLGDSAILLGNGDKWWPYTKEGRETFLAETVSLLTDKSKWEKWSKRGYENSGKYSWEDCAKRWQGLFNE